jgi:tRNA threonylcarbamoyladenosine biosynthesis protein TsaB
MMLLAIDTSTRMASLALAREGELWSELTWVAGKNHTAELVPRIQGLLAQAGLGPRELQGVTVAVGPGSFNGVRAGVAVAKAMAFALNLPLIGVSSLEVQAYPFATTGLPVCALQEAGRGQMAAAIYQTWYRKWRPRLAERLVTWEELVELLCRPTIVCGEINPHLALELKRRLGRRALLAPPAAAPRRAGYLAELGWQRLRQGELLHPALIQPLYLRRPAITQRRKP